MINLSRWVLLGALVGNLGCIDSRPSTGQCSVTVMGQVSTLTIDPGDSYFFRDDDILGDEDAPLRISYGGGAWRVSGELDDLPDSRYLGEHRPPTEDRLRLWSNESRFTTSSYNDTVVTLTAAGRERVVGSFRTSFAEGSAQCTFDLRRAYEHDTDD